ncbi:E3 ubiquitin ligase BIG BROTHER-related [Tetrabaena socialis]|uniref:E3 ubiquitin ligase BIG BROTHER-related n=1 Tax=Tetrabaena socialis TaxID=47790 RepID=A0A2J8AB00_9CHLO|nr:E3 ubiquitin ligase BIG BROTHER-related [Tetrabaena socialis]|eukprot:PNH09701.1 E3 ubiquitin ligase BIG BROTHER-related [Tetrabaena socialis]
MECLSSVSTSGKGIQDDDLSLARLLQEQERALFLVRSQGGSGSEGETDEELARRLQEEEDIAMYNGTDDDAAPDGDEGDPSQPQPLSYEDMLALGDLAGSVAKGLTAQALDRLPVERVGSLRGGGKVLLDRCCICQEAFEEEDDATPLPCRHCYHSGCVRQWLQQSKACPVCGAELAAS